jgi:hypothetical protein
MYSEKDGLRDVVVDAVASIANTKIKYVYLRGQGDFQEFKSALDGLAGQFMDVGWSATIRCGGVGHGAGSEVEKGPEFSG